MQSSATKNQNLKSTDCFGPYNRKIESVIGRSIKQIFLPPLAEQVTPAEKYIFVSVVFLLPNLQCISSPNTMINSSIEHLILSVHRKKSFSIFPSPVGTYQTLPGREIMTSYINHSRLGRVWSVTSRLGKGMSKSFFTVYKRKIIIKIYDRLDSTKSMVERTRLLKFSFMREEICKILLLFRRKKSSMELSVYLHCDKCFSTLYVPS